MAKATKTGTGRKPPAPTGDHAEIDAWIGRQMPDLQPIVRHLDGLIRKTIPGLQYAIKWQKAYYGLPDLGWIIEMVSYDVSVNVVFLAGAEFPDPPPDGSGTSRYVKVKSLAEAKTPTMNTWIEQAGKTEGWH